jgi:hypothetical protein
VVAYFYNTQRIGGQQTLVTKQLQDHEVLRHFPLCRLKTALLCWQRNKRHPYKQKVISVAAKRMILEWRECVVEANHHVEESNPILSDPLCWLAKRSEHTVVCHPCGYHHVVEGADMGSSEA